MRILVYPHELAMGGSQINAIDIAAATRDLGHDVVIYGQKGVLNSHIDELALEFIPSANIGRRPSPAVASDLRRLIRSRGLDVVHGYEWPPTLEARLGVLRTRATCVSTVMSMAVAPFLPHTVELVVGTKQIEAVERARGRQRVSVIEPPVDTVVNAPRLALDTAALRSEHGIPADGPLVVCVTRLAHELKLEGLLTAIAVIPTLGSDVTFTIVGDGPARNEIVDAAEKANGRAGRRAVVLTGQLQDPRAAYEAADIMLGMGGSAIRSMAFGKPLIVQGEQGFWLTLAPETQHRFEWTGWYGSGDGAQLGPDALRRELRPLLSSPRRRAELGAFGRELAVRRFSLQAAAARQVEIYEVAIRHPDTKRASIAGDASSLARFTSYKAGRWVARARGRTSLDDFNARPAQARVGLGRG